MLGVDGITLLQRSPEAFVAHDHAVEHGKGIKGELVLAEHAELARADDRALLRVHSPLSSFINVDFPAPFGPVKPYRFPGVNAVETSSNKIFAP